MSTTSRIFSTIPIYLKGHLYNFSLLIFQTKRQHTPEWSPPVSLLLLSRRWCWLEVVLQCVWWSWLFPSQLDSVRTVRSVLTEQTGCDVMTCYSAPSWCRVCLLWCDVFLFQCDALMSWGTHVLSMCMFLLCDMNIYLIIWWMYAFYFYFTKTNKSAVRWDDGFGWGSEVVPKLFQLHVCR